MTAPTPEQMRTLADEHAKEAVPRVDASRVGGTRAGDA